MLWRWRRRVWILQWTDTCTPSIHPSIHQAIQPSTHHPSWTHVPCAAGTRLPCRHREGRTPRGGGRGGIRPVCLLLERVGEGERCKSGCVRDFTSAHACVAYIHIHRQTKDTAHVSIPFLPVYTHITLHRPTNVPCPSAWLAPGRAAGTTAPPARRGTTVSIIPCV